MMTQQQPTSGFLRYQLITEQAKYLFAGMIQELMRQAIYRQNSTQLFHQTAEQASSQMKVFRM